MSTGSVANHHTVANQAKRSAEQRDAWRERVDIGNLMERLQAAAEGKEGRELNAMQIKASEVLLDRLVPRLSATEITEVNELDTLSRDDILARIQLLLRSDPSLLTELVALQAREAAQQPSESLQVQPKVA